MYVSLAPSFANSEVILIGYTLSKDGKWKKRNRLQNKLLNAIKEGRDAYNTFLKDSKR